MNGNELRQSTMSDKSVKEVKFDFLNLGNIPHSPSPQNNVDFFISSTVQTTAPTQY